MPQQDLDRSKLREDAIKQSAIADMKQHSDKLIHGFESADETYSRRAIWELVQNARDLSVDCNITICLNDNNFSFSHNGKPFTSSTLLSLIKQVSSKSDDKLNEEIQEDEVEEVGQYGTGFITTHAFGKQFSIKGSLKVADDTYIALEDFEIDRKAPTSTKLAEKLLTQQNAVFDLLEKSCDFTSESTDTTFTYKFDEKSDRENAVEAVKSYTEHYLPLVMALNGHIKSITLINTIDNYNRVYRKGESIIENGITATPIIIDDKPPLNIFSLQDKETEMIIILPLAERSKTRKWDEDMGRLFLYFPLVGTEAWGSNFIIHCGRFSPTNARDGLHLMSSNSQTKEKEESNREIMKIASEMIFSYMKLIDSALSDPINLATIAFQTKGENNLVNDYYKGLKQKWVECFRDIKLVETSTPDESIKPSETSYFSLELINQGEPWDSIFAIANMFWSNLPNKTIAEDWTTIVTEWEDKSIDFIGVEAIAEKIETEGSLDKFDSVLLLKFYKFLHEAGHGDVFEEHSLLPNIKNEFVKRSQLYTADTIHPQFISIADAVIPDVPKKFILNTFNFTSEFKDYSRKQLSKDWNFKFSELAKKLDENNLMEVQERNALIKLCSTFPSLDTRGARGELIELINQYYGYQNDFIGIPNAGEDAMDYDGPFKCLLKDFLYNIYNKSLIDVNWVENNLDFINDILIQITGPGTKQFEDTIKTIPIFPNQNYNLKTQDQLMIEDNIPKELKIIYNDVFDIDVRDTLIHPRSSQHLTHQLTKSGSSLASQVNANFESKGKYTEVLEHPNKSLIFDIVKFIAGKEGAIWSALFPVISENKGAIMMSRVTKKEVKDSLFNILDLKDESKITALGDLAADEDMIRIIRLGKEQLALEAWTQTDFDFKHGIGTHIEQLLMARIKGDIEGKAIQVETLSKQDGQDIVIKYDNDVIYYIEIKSKWSSTNVVSMSRNQIIQAVKNLEVYSLCVVNLVDFYPDDQNRHYPQDISSILHLIATVTDIGSELKPLIETAIIFETDDDAIKLTGDYRATIPKKIYDAGRSFNDFIEFLADKLIEILAKT